MARHHVVIEVGKAHYDVDVMGFVRRRQPSTTDGGRTARFLWTGVRNGTRTSAGSPGVGREPIAQPRLESGAAAGGQPGAVGSVLAEVGQRRLFG
jgi:hypothetical protein